MKSLNTIVLLWLVLALSGCTGTADREQPGGAAVPVFENARQERDYLFMMMAYAVVYKDWQYIKDVETARGYNIGSVIVNESSHVISWGRNEKFARKNGTQHGEVRAIQHYLEQSDNWFLEDCTLYTTLEPCVMCAGMMVMSRIDRVVFGQSDPHYGQAMERMQFASKDVIPADTVRSYPRKLSYHRSPDQISETLDSLYAGQRSPGTTKFLSSGTAEHHFEMATSAFLFHEVYYDENISVLDSARSFFRRIPGEHPLPRSQP